MANRPTIDQLAKASGVSVATVDRVLNKRLPVRNATATRVYEAANRIGFHAAGLIGQRLREELPKVRLGFLLLKSSQPFYKPFAQEMERAVAAVAQQRNAGGIKQYYVQRRCRKRQHPGRVPARGGRNVH